MFNADEARNLTGIGGNQLTLGEAFIHLKVGRKNVITQCQILQDGPMPGDGILGRLFLDSCIIDCTNKNLFFIEKTLTEPRLANKIFPFIDKNCNETTLICNEIEIPTDTITETETDLIPHELTFEQQEIEVRKFLKTLKSFKFRSIEASKQSDEKFDASATFVASHMSRENRICEKSNRIRSPKKLTDKFKVGSTT